MRVASTSPIIISVQGAKDAGGLFPGNAITPPRDRASSSAAAYGRNGNGSQHHQLDQQENTNNGSFQAKSAWRTAKVKFAENRKSLDNDDQQPQQQQEKERERFALESESTDEASSTSGARRRRQHGGGGGGSGSDHTHGSDWRKRISQVFATKRFADSKLERLYQRYFFKQHRFGLMLLMGLVCVVCIIDVTFHYVGGSESLVIGIVLGLLAVLLIACEVYCASGKVTLMALELLCYVVLVAMLTTVALITVSARPRTASEGVWCTIYFIYVMYAFLPVRMKISCLSGLVLALMQICCAAGINYSDSFLWKQVRFCFLHPVSE